MNRSIIAALLVSTILSAPLHAQEGAPSAPQSAAQDEVKTSRNDGPKGPPTPEEAAFSDAAIQTLGMTPEQILQFRNMLQENTRAMNAPIAANPTGSSRHVTVTLEPGEKAPEVRMSGGHVATLVFSDMTGNQWPVNTVNVGNPQMFSAQMAGEEGTSNIVVLTPLAAAPGVTNMVVTLVGHPVPVIMKLVTGVEEIDYRLDVTVQDRGPNAAYETQASTLAPNSDSTLQAFLDGVPPSEAEKLASSNGAVEAWRYEDMMYVRTEAELLSPAYIAKASNVSGVKVFKLMEEPVVVVSKDGQMAMVPISD